MIKQEHILNFNNTLKEISDYDFSNYSSRSFARRVEKILVDYRFTIDTLIKKVREDRNFLEQIVRDITVNTTELFRDPKVWQTIKHRIIRKLRHKKTINIWHAGCSTGQEIYSMLIILHELGLQDKVNITATDINTEVIKSAQRGEYVYRFNIEYIANFKQVMQTNPYNYEEVIDVKFSKYFDIDQRKDIMKVKPFLKNKVTYKKHNLVRQDNIFMKKFDLIFCRNVLIYFNTHLQNKVFGMFADSLERKGFLVLGVHESILGAEASKYVKYGGFYIKK